MTAITSGNSAERSKRSCGSAEMLKSAVYWKLAGVGSAMTLNGSQRGGERESAVSAVE